MPLLEENLTWYLRGRTFLTDTARSREGWTDCSDDPDSPPHDGDLWVHRSEPAAGCHAHMYEVAILVHLDADSCISHIETAVFEQQGGDWTEELLVPFSPPDYMAAEAELEAVTPAPPRKRAGP